jgi:hypothetical protein
MAAAAMSPQVPLTCPEDELVRELARNNYSRT